MGFYYKIHTVDLAVGEIRIAEKDDLRCSICFNIVNETYNGECGYCQIFANPITRIGGWWKRRKKTHDGSTLITVNVGEHPLNTNDK